MSTTIRTSRSCTRIRIATIGTIGIGTTSPGAGKSRTRICTGTKRSRTSTRTIRIYITGIRIDSSPRTGSRFRKPDR